MNQPMKNENKEIYRKNLNDPLDPDNYYAPSLHITKEGLLGIDVGGRVVEFTIEEWHHLGMVASSFYKMPIHEEQKWMIVKIGNTTEKRKVVGYEKSEFSTQLLQPIPQLAYGEEYVRTLEGSCIIIQKGLA